MQPMPTRSKLAELCESEGPWVTIMTPLHGGGPLAKGDPARYRNLVRQAAEQLKTRTNGDGHVIVDQLRAVADDRSVFSAGSPGMVVFANRDGVQLWHLPETVHESAVVDDRPHLEQLLPLVSQPSHFYVVTLSLHDVRVFSCDRFEARPLPMPSDMPERLEDAAGWEIEEQHLQYRSYQPGPAGARGYAKGTWPMYHGQGGGTDDRDTDIEKFIRDVDEVLWRAIPHVDAPTVLICDPKVEGIFRRMTRLPNLLEPAIHGNFDREKASAIHERAWPLVAPLVEQRVREARAHYDELAGTGLTADNLEDVVPLACQGRIETLLVREGTTIEGLFDEESWTVDLKGDGEQPKTDLIDRAASETYLNRGTVHVMKAEEMPGESPVAAILRW